MTQPVPHDPAADPAELEALLTRVFLRAADPGPGRARLALRVLHPFPEGRPACVLVDGRSGQSVVTSGPAAQDGDAELTFTVDAAHAPAFWRGELNPVKAMQAGLLSIRGPLLRALALAPGLKLVQAAYRAETEGTE